MIDSSLLPIANVLTYCRNCDALYKCVHIHSHYFNKDNVIHQTATGVKVIWHDLKRSKETAAIIKWMLTYYLFCLRKYDRL